MCIAAVPMPISGGSPTSTCVGSGATGNECASMITQRPNCSSAHVHRAHAVGRTELVRIVGKVLHVDDQPRDVCRHDLRRWKAVTVQRVGVSVGEPEQLRVERVAIHHEVTACVVGNAGGGVRDVQEERGAEHAGGGVKRPTGAADRKRNAVRMPR